MLFENGERSLKRLERFLCGSDRQPSAPEMGDQVALTSDDPSSFRNAAYRAIKSAFLGHTPKIVPKCLNRLWRLQH